MDIEDPVEVFMFDIWHNEILASEIYKKDNFKIIDHRRESKNNNLLPICVIYCSSNNIWFPNEEWAFKRSFVFNDFYEWEKMRKPNVCKEIWIRDIYKSWYVTGINEKLSSIDSLVEYLKIETKDFEVWTIGSSSGGYMATLLGVLLNAKIALSFSGQFDLNQKGAIDRNPFLQKYQKSDREKYYDLSNILKNSQTEVFYFYPTQNSQDMLHYNRIKDIERIHKIGLKTSKHGVVVLKCCLSKILSFDKNELIELAEYCGKKCFTPYRLALHLVGYFTTWRYIFSECSNHFVEKCRRKNEIK